MARLQDAQAHRHRKLSRRGGRRAKPVFLLIARDSWGVWLFRRPLLARAAREGYHVAVACGSDARFDERVHKLTDETNIIPLAGRSFNPVRDLVAFFHLINIFLRLKPTVVHSFTIKPVIYGGFLAGLTRRPAFVGTITGLGHIFVSSEWRCVLLRRLILLCYRHIFNGPRARLVVQNPSDARLLTSAGIDPSHAILVPGSGVDVHEYVPQPEPAGNPVVLLAGRMLWEKGVAEFAQAAQLIKSAGIAARFVLVGDADPQNRRSIPRSVLEGWSRAGILEWWGYCEDMAGVLARSHLVCLPSYYGEGLPKTLLEAAACGRPVVTTDWPGCRDAILPGQTGLLVEPRSVPALVAALMQLLSDAAQRRAFGQRARELALARFSADHVNDMSFSIYRALLTGR